MPFFFSSINVRCSSPFTLLLLHFFCSYFSRVSLSFDHHNMLLLRYMLSFTTLSRSCLVSSSPVIPTMGGSLITSLPENLPSSLRNTSHERLSSHDRPLMNLLSSLAMLLIKRTFFDHGHRQLSIRCNVG